MFCPSWDRRNTVHFAVRRLDAEDMDAATEMALMVAEFFCDAVYDRDGASALVHTVDRSITLWRELADIEGVSADASAVDVGMPRPHRV